MVFIPNVHPTGEGDAVIDNDDLAMVTQIDGPAVAEGGTGEGRGDLDPGLAERAEKLPTQPERAQAIVETTYADSSAGPGDQQFPQPIACAVGLPDVVLEMNGVAGGGERLFDQAEGAVGVINDFDRVARGSGEACQAMSEPEKAGLERALYFGGENHPETGRREQLTKSRARGLPERDATFDAINSKDEEQHRPQVGEHDDGHHPGKCRRRISPGLQQHDGQQQQRDEIALDKEPRPERIHGRRREEGDGKRRAWVSRGESQRQGGVWLTSDDQW